MPIGVENGFYSKRRIMGTCELCGAICKECAEEGKEECSDPENHCPFNL